jgi:transcription initiation factor TFIID subunit 5
VHGPLSQADLNAQVLEYLNKKGYSKTEATLRREVADRDDGTRPAARKVQDKGYEKFSESYGTSVGGETTTFILT